MGFMLEDPGTIKESMSGSVMTHVLKSLEHITGSNKFLCLFHFKITN